MWNLTVIMTRDRWCDGNTVTATALVSVNMCNIMYNNMCDRPWGFSSLMRDTKQCLIVTGDSPSLGACDSGTRALESSSLTLVLLLLVSRQITRSFLATLADTLWDRCPGGYRGRDAVVNHLSVLSINQWITMMIHSINQKVWTPTHSRVFLYFLLFSTLYNNSEDMKTMKHIWNHVVTKKVF